MSDLNQPNEREGQAEQWGRWGQTPASDQPQQLWQAQPAPQQFQQQNPPQYGAPVTPIEVAPPTARGLVNPLVVSGAAAVLLVVSLVGFVLNWVKVVLDFSVESYSMQVEGRMNGFGILKLTENMTDTSDSDTDAQFLAFAILSLVIIVVGAACVFLLRKTPAVGAGLLVVAGALQVIAAILGLLRDETGAVIGDDSGLSDYQRRMFDDLVDSLDVTKGPGQYIVLLTGVLLIALGVLYIWQTHRDSAALVSAGLPGIGVTPGAGMPGSFLGTSDQSESAATQGGSPVSSDQVGPHGEIGGTTGPNQNPSGTPPSA